MQKKWWKEAVVYQVYPRSFNDSNGDGIGDLQGIIQKIDYLSHLGVDVVWLSPIYKSPNHDNGYDISDYYSIMDEFGTLSDWDTLIQGLHKRGIKLMMDLVVNHTSDEHQWFVDAQSSKESRYRNYYTFKPGKSDGPPNNWRSFFSEEAWSKDQTNDEYYLHLYSNKMPDLNWDNKNLRQEIYAMMTWWLDKGIDGFRLDTINTIGKDPHFPDAPEGANKYVRGREFFTNQPQMHEVLREMHEVMKPYNVMSVGECSSADCDEAVRMAGYERNELNMVHQFEFDELDWGDSTPWKVKPWKLSDLKKVFQKWHNNLSGKAWSSVFFGNHDLPRPVSRFGDEAYRVESAKVIATTLLTVDGTPYLYQGDEIGMTNANFESIEDYKDIDTLQYYSDAKAEGLTHEEIMNVINYRSRDNSRTPMQWNSDTSAGFTTGTPWIKINQNFTEINVEHSLEDPQSVLNFYRDLIAIRKESEALVYGDFNTYDIDNEQIYCYTRKSRNEMFLIVLNFSTEIISYILPEELINKQFTKVLGNYQDCTTMLKNEILLRPYEAYIAKLL